MCKEQTLSRSTVKTIPHDFNKEEKVGKCPVFTNFMNGGNCPESYNLFQGSYLFQRVCLEFFRTVSCFFLFFVFLSIWVFFHELSRFTGQQTKGEGVYLTPLYHFHQLHRHLDISRATTAESPSLHIASIRT